jgi:hypothetical protein
VERYGYANRVLRDEQETDRIARRLASFDKQAIADTKSCVDASSLPDNAELRPGLTAFFAAAGSPRPRRGSRLWPRTGSEAAVSWSADWASWSRLPPHRPTPTQRQEPAAHPVSGVLDPPHPSALAALDRAPVWLNSGPLAAVRVCRSRSRRAEAQSRSLGENVPCRA